jgi:hypothetical protein
LGVVDESSLLGCHVDFVVDDDDDEKIERL